MALIFGSMAATLVSLFFIPVLMDNARAMMPDDHDHSKDECEEGDDGTWCMLTNNIKSFFPKKKEEDCE